MHLRSIVGAAFLLLGSCGGGSAPSCEEMADHVAALAKQESQIELAPRDDLIRNCQAEQSSNGKLRRCVAKATTLEQAKSCELAAALEHMNR
jgi:hypothetical protein